jgi:nitrate/nitrite transport system permease protein
MLDNLSTNQRAAVLSVVMLVVGLLIWEAAIPAQKAASELTEYERLTGGGAPQGRRAPAQSGSGQGVGATVQPVLRCGPQ